MQRQPQNTVGADRATTTSVMGLRCCPVHGAWVKEVGALGARRGLWMTEVSDGKSSRLMTS